MDVVIKLNSQVAGKDKVARLLQYTCRTLWDSLNQKNEVQLAFIHQLKSLEYLLSSFRKCKSRQQKRNLNSLIDEMRVINLFLKL